MAGARPIEGHYTKDAICLNLTELPTFLNLSFVMLMFRGLPFMFTVVSALQQMVITVFNGIMNLNPTVFEELKHGFRALMQKVKLLSAV